GDGKQWCGYSADDAHDPKNRGDPPCPRCGPTQGNPVGNPINIATGNKIQREVDFSIPETGHSSLSATTTQYCLPPKSASEAAGIIIGRATFLSLKASQSRPSAQTGRF